MTSTGGEGFVGALEDALADVGQGQAKRENRVAFLLKLPRPWHFVLKQRAHRRGSTITDLINEAIERYLEL